MDIDIKELIKAAAEGFDLKDFKGDVVGVKVVENEIGNVETGGIGVQKVYGNIMTGDKYHILATDEQISRAIAAINGKDKVLKHQQAFLGVCCYLASCHKWPHNKEASVNRLNQLPGADKWNVPCKWESIRKFVGYRFATTDFADWDDYTPKEAEREIFVECRDVARAFDEQLMLEMQK